MSSDYRPQYKASNTAISKWGKINGMLHERSSSKNPGTNGEAKSAVKWVKAAVNHAVIQGQNV